jgi:esterase/lipase superfamily enzyme
METQTSYNEKGSVFSSILKEYNEKQNAINIRQFEINTLKSKLQATDYKAIKYAEGELSEEEYAETREQRRAWRAEINILESQIATLKNQ